MSLRLAINAAGRNDSYFDKRVFHIIRKEWNWLSEKECCRSL